MGLQLTAWATLATIIVYIWIFTNVGKARRKFKIFAPASEGPIEFQSVLRVQANTVEQMVIFYPALWMCAYFFSDRWAALGGLAWAIGRVVYALGYYQAPEKRGPGFGITGLSTLALLICTVIGLFSH